MTVTEIILLNIAGFLAGFINTLAGGGSMITLAMLIMVGLPAPVANGTNRVAIFLQTLAATGSFRQQKVLDTRKALALGIPSVLGSIIGAKIAVDINERVFERAIGVILILMLFIILAKPKRWLKGHTEITASKVTVWQVILFFLIGIYGGFIHVGVGYFLLAGIVLGAGYDLVRANAIKVMVVLLYVPFTLLVFMLSDQVNYLYGFIMAIGNVLGAVLASRMAVKRGSVFVQWVMVVVILLTSADLFGLLDIKYLVSLIL
ncbi:MAG TPA: sulfite exporter TauE/SafE family protein [Bacteroidales bacterium]|nr:sulfite exporter TauE/SafE family protein [Bacteroidales bacterium]